MRTTYHGLKHMLPIYSISPFHCSSLFPDICLFIHTRSMDGGGGGIVAAQV